MEIRKAELSDSLALAEIYNFYIENSHATFETQLIDREEMERRQRELSDSQYPFFVAESEGIVVGYTFGHRYRPRDAYRHSVETSVYIRPGFEGKHFGTALYEVLIPELMSAGFHALIAGISLPNEASIKLHEKFGFQKVAQFREVGNKFGIWIDVGYWELLNP
jgi:L-amino acid N-acyltransferase YncA